MPCTICGSPYHDRSACPMDSGETACSIYRQWLEASLWPYSWAAQVASGWVIGWLQGATRNSYTPRLLHMPTLRTPLLRMQIERLKLNANAPYPRQKREAAQVLLLKR